MTNNKIRERYKIMNSKVNVTQKDCKFYVDRANGVVACVLRNTKYILHNDLAEKNPYVCQDIIEITNMPDQFIGVARCGKGDNFDEQVGRKLAFYRLKKKFYSSYFKRANAYFNAVDRIIGQQVEQFNQIGLKVGRNLDKMEEQLKDYLPEGE